MNSFTLIILSLLVCLTSCEKPTLNEKQASDSITEQTDDDWVTFLEELNFESIILVQKEDVIMDALKEASEGDVLFLEAGNYKETVTLDQPNIAIIGVGDSEHQKVMISSPNHNGIKISDQASNSEVINIRHQIKNEKSRKLSLYPPNRTKRGNHFLRIKRTELSNGIAHYQFSVRVGREAFDIVRIHRVVKEHRPFRPVRTESNVFMVHGGSQDFDDIFLRPGIENANVQNSSPLYLASKDIDVWGIDLGWTLVPEETTDFAFMQDWGVQRDAGHVLKAMSIARLVRGFTRQGFGRMNLLGFSYGVSVAYAATGRETQQHYILRDVKGLIAVDGAMKYDPQKDEASRILACDRASSAQNAYNDGVYQTSNGVNFAPIGELAITSPDETSPFIPGLTNYQFGLFVGATPIGNPPAPFWHFVGGDFVGSVPVGLLYTDPLRWFKLLSSLAPYQPQLQGIDVQACLCDEEEVSIDDFLVEIKVPILYLGAAGGYGPQGLYTSSLTKSNDITHHIVSKQSENLRLIDYGHADLFMGEDAAELVWEVLRQWLAEHHHKFGS